MSKNIETKESLLSTIPIDGPRLIVIKDTQDFDVHQALEGASIGFVKMEGPKLILEQYITNFTLRKNKTGDLIYTGIGSEDGVMYIFDKDGLVINESNENVSSRLNNKGLAIFDGEIKDNLDDTIKVISKIKKAISLLFLCLKRIRSAIK